MLAARALTLAVVAAAAFNSATLLGAVAPSNAEAELDKPTRIEFKTVPLNDAADYLGVQHEIRITIEPAVGKDVVITYLSGGGTLRQELTNMLSPHKLGFEVRDGVLVIVPEKKK